MTIDSHDKDARKPDAHEEWRQGKLENIVSDLDVLIARAGMTHALLNERRAVVQLGTAKAMAAELQRYYGSESCADVVEAPKGTKIGDEL